jgi:LPS-assembly protein
MRPFVQYRAMPGADQKLGTAPPAERAVAVNILEELDLADRLDAATTRDTQSMRMGVRNTLATRSENGASRDLLRADFFTDWRDGPTEQEDGRGDFHARLRWTPIDWLALDSAQRLPNGGGAPLESIQSVRVKSGDLWSAEVNWIEFNRLDPTKQLAANATVRLNSVFSLSGTSLYDVRSGRNIGQWLRLQQSVGNTWMIEYGLERFSDPREPRNLGFYVEFRLFRF